MTNVGHDVLFYVSYLDMCIILKSFNEGRTFLFNDALNTFYFWLNGLGHLLMDHSARQETHCHHSPISNKESLYVIAHTMLWSTGGTRNSSLGPS